jgi:signal transduction histidine kinase
VKKAKYSKNHGKVQKPLPVPKSSSPEIVRKPSDSSKRDVLQKRKLRREVVGRMAAEDSLRTSEGTRRELLEESLAMQEELRLMSHRLLFVQEEERKRVSRELHDVIAQTLAGINIRLAALKVQTADPAKLKRNITATQRLVMKSFQTVSRFARDLRPAVLDDLGLIPALHSFMNEFMKQTGVRARLVAPQSVEFLGTDQKTAFYRIVQEALSNVERHAKATRVQVVIQSADDSFLMEVTDNGGGFSPGLRLADRRKHLGLVGMRERAEMMGGACRVSSTPGQGTTVRVEFQKKPSSPRRSNL